MIEPLKEDDDPATVPFKQVLLLEECLGKDVMQQLRNEEDPTAAGLKKVATGDTVLLVSGKQIVSP